MTKAQKLKDAEFIMELPPEAHITQYKGSFIVAQADCEPFMIVGTKAKVIRYIKSHV